MKPARAPFVPVVSRIHHAARFVACEGLSSVNRARRENTGKTARGTGHAIVLAWRSGAAKIRLVPITLATTIELVRHAASGAMLR